MPEQGLTAVSKAHLVPAGDFAGTVHSVFATACNLAVDGLLVTVHDAGLPHTPTSVRVASRETGPWSPAARPGDPVRCRAGILSFGEHTLDLRELPIWSPGPVPPPAGSATVARLADEVAALRDRHLRTHPLPAWDLGDRTAQLSTALLGPEPLDHTVGRLIGLGPGLTPAGDDLLVGLLAALHRARPAVPQAGPARRAVARRAQTAGHARHVIAHRVLQDAHRTTDISAHYLRLAATGEFGEPLTRLVDAIAGGAARTTVPARTQDVLRTGASSGADAVAGVLLGVRALVPPPVQKAA